ncbi:hypothetical protein [Fibrobacter sp. UWEL]|uniref:hypothetical protein n=1 Tax=Fibrobacter sp. UWEL TaxID=1896209 RepID=UPI000911CD4B|nr:hypothetical protein [Fibrobacter sp. UWEL]SHK63140.1 hypothetical protein SAMN05720468_104109 [Fibrobacter sp. UWEL]
MSIKKTLAYIIPSVLAMQMASCSSATKPNVDWDEDSEEAYYVDPETDKVYKGEKAVEQMFNDSTFNKSNVAAYTLDFDEHQFSVSSYIVFFATMDTAAVEGERLTMYFDGLWEQKDPKKYRYISVYYLPDDFDYNRGTMTGGTATLAFRAPVTIQNPNRYPDNDTTLYHSGFSTKVDDVIHTGLKWDGKHRQIMVIHSTDHTSSTALLSKRGGKSLFFKEAPSWTQEAYKLSEVGATFDIPMSRVTGLRPSYSAENGIFVTTESGAISKSDVETTETSK